VGFVCLALEALAVRFED
jgi:hypothetical protein